MEALILAVDPSDRHVFSSIPRSVSSRFTGFSGRDSLPCIEPVASVRFIELLLVIKFGCFLERRPRFRIVARHHSRTSLPGHLA
jgi:hypothetical protein